MKLLSAIVALIVILLAGIFINAPSHIRLRYQATIVDDYFKTAQFEFFQSYSLKEERKRCLRSAIFFGGSCWEYFKHPTEEQLNKIKRDARQKMENIFGPNNFTHRNVDIVRFGWNDLPTDYRFPSGAQLRNNYQFFHQEPDSIYIPPQRSTTSPLGEM